MSKIDQLKKFWEEADCKLEVVNAPLDAQTFDKMIVIVSGTVADKKILRRVSLYNSKLDKIVSEY